MSLGNHRTRSCAPQLEKAQCRKADMFRKTDVPESGFEQSPPNKSVRISRRYDKHPARGDMRVGSMQECIRLRNVLDHVDNRDDVEATFCTTLVEFPSHDLDAASARQRAGRRRLYSEFSDGTR